MRTSGIHTSDDVLLAMGLDTSEDASSRGGSEQEDSINESDAAAVLSGDDDEYEMRSSEDYSDKSESD